MELYQRCSVAKNPYLTKTLYDNLLWPSPKYLFWATNTLKKISVFFVLAYMKTLTAPS